MAHRFPRINQTVLTAFLVVSLPGLVGGVLLALLVGQSQMRQFYGRHLALIAEQSAAVVDAYIYRKILDISVLGRTPQLRASAAVPGRAPSATLFDNPSSAFLADVVRQDQVYRELILTNREGWLVAASRRMADIDRSDEDWWEASAGDGTAGRVFVTDVRWDDAVDSLVLEVAVPVPPPGDESFSGVLKAVVDARELLAAVAGLRPGETGQATLVRNNGSIVFSRTTLDANARFFASDALRKRLAAAGPGQGDERFMLEAEGADGAAYVIGVAPSQLRRSYPNLSWYVAVSQAEHELLAPMRTIGTLLALVAGATLLLVFAVAFWFSMRLAAPPMDVDMALVRHARVVRMPDTGEDEAGEDDLIKAG